MKMLEKKMKDIQGIINILSSRPSLEELSSVLEDIFRFQEKEEIVNSENTKIMNILTNEILPEYLPLILSKDITLLGEKVKKFLLGCLSSVSGIKAILLRIKKITMENGNSFFFQHIAELLEILQVIFCNEGRLILIWMRCHFGINENENVKSFSSLIWDEYVSLIAGGKLLGIASEGLVKLWKYCEIDQRPVFWIADGSKYVEHFGNEIVASLNDTRFNEKMEKDFSVLTGRLFNLGYTAQIISSFFRNETITHDYLLRLDRIVKHFTSFQKTMYIHSLFSFFDKKYFQNTENFFEKLDICHELYVSEVEMISTIIKDILEMDNDIIDIVNNWFLNFNSKTNIYTKKAIVNSYCSFTNDLEADDNILVRLCSKWSNKIFINHVPVIEQEDLTQKFLLFAAFVPRNILEKLSHSNAYLNGLTNRLSSSSERVRFLGMIVGESVTRKLFPNDEKKWLTFNVESTLTSESNWWRNIINVDNITNIKSLSLEATDKHCSSSLSSKKDTIKEYERIQPIQEDGTVVAKDDEFVPYALPDSDDDSDNDSNDDSDDDPAFTEKNKKINAPVYIRELISMLKDNTSYPKLHMALKTSPNLIRRKANFGTELTKEAITLAQIISSMNDEFNMDKFIELKQESMTALVATCPELVASYFIEQYFTGDISIQQRYMILSALALGAREISGIDSSKNKMFPSKILASKFHQQYISPIDIIVKEMNLLSVKQNVSNLTNIDSLDSINPLKVRRFSKKTEIMKNKQLPKANPLAPIAGKSFIFPMIGYWFLYTKDTSNNYFHYEPLLLSQFLKTIAIIFQASYPASSQHEILHEIWEFSFFLQNQTDLIIKNALLFLILTLLEITDEKLLIQKYSHELVQSRHWVSAILENASEEETRLLSSCIILRITSLFESYKNTFIYPFSNIIDIQKFKS
ncbi:hypothetical protein T552_01204 [Pneumocystis carinii B80]|uniref:Telomere length regulation protein conserved domain-containing protein n=1 Tax=Pneumocystis carinii (strain B80) TaxID=1408658 RepID=A0A0W4ZLK1_PNEC8|nr:hypothetical protein T552_01204 [Pneumocystis carinii B80]KTW29249.1 hypothetical protein T552_01204 [Pneumocystis carinii B80]